MKKDRWNILYMDDDSDSANMVKLHLTNLDSENKILNIDFYSSSEEVLKAVKKKHKIYDLFLLDYQMLGEKNGIEVLRQLREDSIYDIPAILISAVVTEADKVAEALEVGFATFIPKHHPEMPQRVFKAILELLASKNDFTIALEKLIRDIPECMNETISLPADDNPCTVKDVLNKIKSIKNSDSTHKKALSKFVIGLIMDRRMKYLNDVV